MLGLGKREARQRTAGRDGRAPQRLAFFSAEGLPAGSLPTCSALSHSLSLSPALFVPASCVEVWGRASAALLFQQPAIDLVSSMCVLCGPTN